MYKRDIMGWVWNLAMYETFDVRVLLSNNDEATNKTNKTRT
jgi:hypothetical protein